MADTSNPVLNNVVPWGLHPVPKFVTTTLKNRAKAYAWNKPTDNDTGAVRSAWSRVCSNGKPRDPNHDGRYLDGFILMGPNTDAMALGAVGFNESLGIGDNIQVIGYDVEKVPHLLQSRTFPNRPPPALSSIETEFYGAGSSFPGLCRKATIKWKCFSVEQLEYITPYFLSLRVSMVIEWGWNQYNAASLVDLSNRSALVKLFMDGSDIHKRVELSNGDYDCMVGRIIDYGYTMDSQGNYEGFTVVVNPAFMLEGLNTQNQTGVQSDSKNASGLVDFVKNRFDSIPTDNKSKFFGWEQLLARRAKDNNWIYVKPKEKYPKIEPAPKFWVNMQFVQELFNLFGRIQHPNVGPDLDFRFSNSIIGAHPLIKPCRSGSENKNVDVLIPNAFSPRLMRASGPKGASNANVGENRGSLKRIESTDPATEDFRNSAQKLATQLSKLGLTSDTDDMQKLLNSKGSFPRMTKPPFTDVVHAGAKPGYWGYLGDIYISNTLLKEAIELTDTMQRALEYILGKVSTSCGNFWEFRIIPSHGKDITVIDNNFCPITTDNLAKNLENFKIGSTEESCFTEYGMNVQMKQEMATQTLLGPNSVVDPKGQQFVEAFASDDRLFHTPGSFEIMKPSNPSEDELKRLKDAEEARKKDAESAMLARSRDTDCVILERSLGGGKVERFYLTEKDPEFMKKIVQLNEFSDSSEPSPLASPMMPGTEFTFECQGVAGFAFLGMFTLSSVPRPYDNTHAVFQVDGVKHLISENNWRTSITAKVRPLTTLSK